MKILQVISTYKTGLLPRRRFIDQSGATHLILGLGIIVALVIGYSGFRLMNAGHAASASPSIVGLGSKCLDNFGNVQAINNFIDLYDCNGSPAQRWEYVGGRIHLIGTTFCLDIPSDKLRAQTNVQLWTCHSGTNQQWVKGANASIVNPQTGLCLDVKYAATANKTPIWIYGCNGTAAQRWTFIAGSTSTPAPTPPAPTPPSPTPTPPTPAPTPPATTRPTGAGITPYESLGNKGSFNTTANGVSPAAQLSFLPGTYQFSNFNDASVYGVLLWHNILGIRGSGVNSTTFQMAPGSSNKASSVPAQSTFASGGTNPLYLMRIDQSPTLSDFTLLGTNQGHLYNGLNLYQTTNAKINNVRIKGIPGDNGANPGETFAVNVYRNTNATFNNVEIDGKNSAGQKVGASGIGINFGSNTTFNDLYVHDMQYGSGVAAYTTTNVTYNRPRIVGNVYGLNFERVNGTVNIVKPYFRDNIIPNSTSYHITIANDQNSGTFNIYDPDFDGPKLRVRVSGYLGHNRTQDPNAVKLYINGVLRQDMMDLKIQTL